MLCITVGLAPLLSLRSVPTRSYEGPLPQERNILFWRRLLWGAYGMHVCANNSLRNLQKPISELVRALNIAKSRHLFSTAPSLSFCVQDWGLGYL